MTFSNWIKACRPSAEFSGFIGLLAHTTTSNARLAGKRCLNISRISRLVKFLAVAVGVFFLLIAIPSLAKPHSFSSAYTANHLLTKPFFRNARLKTALCLMRRQDGSEHLISDGKSCAAFGSTSIDHCPPPLGFHANQEPVGTFSFSH